MEAIMDWKGIYIYIYMYKMQTLPPSETALKRQFSIKFCTENVYLRVLNKYIIM